MARPKWSRNDVYQPTRWGRWTGTILGPIWQNSWRNGPRYGWPPEYTLRETLRPQKSGRKRRMSPPENQIAWILTSHLSTSLSIFQTALPILRLGKTLARVEDTQKVKLPRKLPSATAQLLDFG